MGEGEERREGDGRAEEERSKGDMLFTFFAGITCSSSEPFSPNSRIKMKLKNKRV